LKSLFFTRASAIKIGNIANTYLGRALNVPLDIGIRKQIKAKIMYDNLIFFFHITKSITTANINEENSNKATNHSK
jgi:hypothetical protein